jgi:tetratricopeptide (TPR) repeat protein
LVLVSGRIQGFYYRDFFTGRRLLDAGKFAEAIPYIERFLESIRQHPKRELLLWLSWSIYTPSVVAMAINNIGVAQLNLGDVDTAESNFLRALARDPLYPLPHFNMAIVQELRGNRNGALAAIATARQLGYMGGTIDVIINKSQSLLARIEGFAA